MVLIVRFLVILHLLALVLARLSLARLFIGDFFRPKNFDISKKITNIKQVHKKPPSFSEYSSDYYLTLNNSNLEIIYEF
jgi:hypothetical protein